MPCMDKVFGYIARCVQKHENMAPFMTTHALFGDPKHEDPAMMHRWIYSIHEMRELLTNAGMREIEFCAPRYHFPGRDMRLESIK